MSDNIVNSEHFMLIKVSHLQKAEWNYKKEDEKQQAKLVANMRKNGQVENILVREIGKDQYEVVNGNHRLSAFIELGVEAVMCYNFGKISLAQAKRIAVETNETKFESDYLALGELISGLTEDFQMDDLVETMPFTEEKILAFKENDVFDWEGSEDEIKSDKPEPEGDGTLTLTYKMSEEVGEAFNAKVKQIMERFETADEAFTHMTELLGGEDE